MSSLTKEIHFTSDAEGWIASASDGQIWQAWYPQHKSRSRALTDPHSPRTDPPLSIMGGCLRTTARRNAPTTINYWQLATTWEALGIPAGATVTNCQGNYIYRVSLFNKKPSRHSDPEWTASGGGSGAFTLSGSGDGADQDYDYDGMLNGRDAFTGMTDGHYTVDFNGGEYEVLNGGSLWYDGQSGSVPTQPWEETSWKTVGGSGDITLTPSGGSNPLASGPFELRADNEAESLIDTFSAADYAPARSSGGDLAYPLSGGNNFVSFIMAAWREIVGSNIAVPEAYQASTTNLKFRLGSIMPATIDDQRKWVRLKQDYVKLIITYEEAVSGVSSGGMWFGCNG